MEEIKSPAISVIMATFNDNLSYLEDAINSILQQTFTDFEFIIVDDSINNCTIKYLEEKAEKDQRIRIVHSNQKKGFVASLNIGLNIAQGKYIARMDGDDISYLDRFAKQYLFLEKNIDIDLVGTNCYIINENRKITSKIKFPTNKHILNIYSILRCPLQHGTVMFRKKLLNEGFYYDENFKKCEDLELWLRLLKSGKKIANIPIYLYEFRIGNNYAKKRSKEHFLYNVKARKINFTFKRFFSGTIGILISELYTLIPTKIKSYLYYLLNK